MASTTTLLPLQRAAERILTEQDFLSKLHWTISKRGYINKIQNATDNQLKAVVNCIENHKLLLGFKDTNRENKILRFKNTAHKPGTKLKSFLLKKWAFVQVILNAILYRISFAQIVQILLNYES